MTYEAILQKLIDLETVTKKKYLKNSAQNFYNEFKLEHLKEIYNDLNLRHYSKVHIAGTNGKGSVSTKLSDLMIRSGYKCGLYTSPHISSYRERIQVDGQIISKEDVKEGLTILFKVMDQKGLNLSFFEVTTLLALWYFSSQKVDVAIIEVGLGGRLDATNIIDPLLCIITSISFDHQEYLGNTLEKIAAEKAGIIKPKVSLVIGPNARFKAIYHQAKEKKASTYQVDGSYDDYNLENDAIAKRAKELLQKHFHLKEHDIRSDIRPPCRYQKVNYKNKTFILDVAHNQDGIEHLFTKLRKDFSNKELKVIFGHSFGHDVKLALAVTQKYFPKVICPKFKSARLFDPSQIEELSSSIEIEMEKVAAFNPDDLIESCKNSDVFVCFGSLYMMSEVREKLGIIDEKDPEEIGVFMASTTSSQSK